jgi:hypothetical protein
MISLVAFTKQKKTQKQISIQSATVNGFGPEKNNKT